MTPGDIVLIPFPFAELNVVKARPAVLICETADSYKDLVLVAISSVIPPNLTRNEFLVTPDSENHLRKRSLVKVDRVVTLKAANAIHKLGRLSKEDFQMLQLKFRSLLP